MINSNKLQPGRKEILRATRINVYGSLMEKYGSESSHLEKEKKMGFQLDRLFTVVHCN